MAFNYLAVGLVFNEWTYQKVGRIAPHMVWIIIDLTTKGRQGQWRQISIEELSRNLLEMQLKYL